MSNTAKRMSNLERKHNVYSQNFPLDFPFRLLSTDYVQAMEKSIFRRIDYPYTTIEYVVSGKGTLEIGGSEYNIESGDIYILQKKHDHYFYPDKKEPWEKIYFTADGQLISQLFMAYGLEEHFHVKNVPAYHLFQEMHKLHFSGDDWLHRKAAVIFHQILMLMYTEKFKEMKNYSDNVLKIKKFLDNNIENKIFLEDVCKATAQSESQVIHSFRNEIGQPPYDYLMTKRIELAKFLLTTTTLNIKEIAFKLQFADQYYFSNFFKKKTGISPSKFRKPIEP